MSTETRYGVRWPDGSVTGLITDKEHLARAYAREHDGTIYRDHDPLDYQPGKTADNHYQGEKHE